MYLYGVSGTLECFSTVTTVHTVEPLPCTQYSSGCAVTLCGRVFKLTHLEFYFIVGNKYISKDAVTCGTGNLFKVSV